MIHVSYDTKLLSRGDNIQIMDGGEGDPQTLYKWGGGVTPSRYTTKYGKKGGVTF